MRLPRLSFVLGLGAVLVLYVLLARPPAAPTGGPSAAVDAAPVAATATPRPPGPTPEPREGIDYTAGEVLVRFRPDIDPARQQAALARVGAQVAEPPGPSGLVRLALPPGVTVDQALDRLASDPAVAVAGPNYRYRTQATPSDPCYNGTTGCSAGQRWYYELINAPLAWNTTTGAASVVVAVVDTGAEATHSDLAPALWTNPGETPGNGVDDDGNGCIDDVHGCNFSGPYGACPADPSYGTGDVTDTDGHGTYVAGEILAAWNSSGVAGLAPGVRLMVVRALDCNGTGFTSDLANGIAYAAAGGARVVNLSLGGDQPDPALESTINAVVAAGVVVVAAAGNCGNVTSPVPGCPAQNAPMYPAAYPAVIAVSASDGPSNPDGRASFSNWGDYVDLAAPGVGVCSTTRGGGYACNLAGTSMATPLVSGVAALLLSAKPGLSPAQVADQLKAFAVNLPDGSTPNWDGAGRVNAIAVALPYRAAAPGVAR